MWFYFVCLASSCFASSCLAHTEHWKSATASEAIVKGRVTYRYGLNNENPHKT